MDPPISLPLHKAYETSKQMTTVTTTTRNQIDRNDLDLTTRNAAQSFIRGDMIDEDDDSVDEEAGGRLDSYYCYFDEDENDEERTRRNLKFYLADRRYHLPGNNACEDWIQYFLNNHPVLGICCHHPYHPIKFHLRILMLITSVSFGLGATSFVIMWYWYDQTADEKLVGINKVVITKEMVAIFLFGSALHSVFDWVVWHTFACTACQPGGPLERYESCKWVGQHVAALICMLTIGFSGGLVWFRATSLEHYLSFSEFAFIIPYLLEIVLSLFLFSPILSTLLFSGILGCYRIPVLGGRPFELRAEERARRRKEKKRIKQQLKQQNQRMTSSAKCDMVLQEPNIRKSRS